MFVSPHKETLTPSAAPAHSSVPSPWHPLTCSLPTQTRLVWTLLQTDAGPPRSFASGSFRGVGLRQGAARPRARCSSIPPRACPCHLSAHRLVDVRAPPSGYCESHCHDPLCAVFVWTCVSTLLGRYLGVELMGRMAFLEPAG